jgi:hypothetical protein
VEHVEHLPQYLRHVQTKPLRVSSFNAYYCTFASFDVTRHAVAKINATPRFYPTKNSSPYFFPHQLLRLITFIYLIAGHLAIICYHCPQSIRHFIYFFIDKSWETRPHSSSMSSLIVTSSQWGTLRRCCFDIVQQFSIEDKFDDAAQLK